MPHSGLGTRPGMVKLWAMPRFFASLILGAALTGPLGAEQAVDTQPSRVYYITDNQAVGDRKAAVPSVVRRMVDRLVMDLTGQSSVPGAWLALVRPTDVVGIKVSTSAGPLGGTRAAVVEAVAAGLRAAGLPRERVLVWDRDRESLVRNGFREDHPDYVLRWIDPRSGYDPKALVTAPVLGRLIWGDSRFGEGGGRFADLLESGEQLSSTSYFAKILSREVTAVIHVPSAMDSFLTGVHGALAGMTLNNLDNWRRFVKAPERGDPYIAEIYADDTIRKKVVLTILDALIVQYAGGPLPAPNFTIDNGALFASRDPVAIDATLVEMVDRVRASSKLPPVRPMTTYLESAKVLGLGEFVPERIETIRAGVGEYR